MTTEKLENAIHAQPFLPFALRVADGRSLRVPHPDVILEVPGGRTAIVAGPDESHDVVGLLLITSLEFDPPVVANS